MTQPIVYFDNAATTPLDMEVAKLMYETMIEFYGNPSSVHAIGRKAKNQLIKARASIARSLNCTPGEIIFTSGGTESDNWVLKQAVDQLEVKHIVSSPIEHPAVLKTMQILQEKGLVRLSFLDVDRFGQLDYAQLEQLLEASSNVLVSIMHSNNEIGTIANVEKISILCKKHNALFHCDAVQSVGYYEFDMSLGIYDFLAGSSHKFNGPKGVGFLYKRKGLNLPPLISGGSQENGYRGGTENLVSIVGMAKALEICTARRIEAREHICQLKKHMAHRLTSEIHGMHLNSLLDESSSYKILSCCMPVSQNSQALLLNLDLLGICVSGGSACSSGSANPSHVLAAIKADVTRSTIRFSFGLQNTLDEVNFVVDELKKLLI